MVSWSDSKPVKPTNYHESGVVSAKVSYRANPNDFSSVWYTVDALGRVTAQTFERSDSAVLPVVSTTYDPFDRPIKVVDDRLAMNTAGDDRAAYYRYDELGNLVKEFGPRLRTADGAGYTSAQRPYAEYDYDGLGRRVTERRLLAGSVDPSSLAGGSGRWPPRTR